MRHFATTKSKGHINFNNVNFYRIFNHTLCRFKPRTYLIDFWLVNYRLRFCTGRFVFDRNQFWNGRRFKFLRNNVRTFSIAPNWLYIFVSVPTNRCHSIFILVTICQDVNKIISHRIANTFDYTYFDSGFFSSKQPFLFIFFDPGLYFFRYCISI